MNILYFLLLVILSSLSFASYSSETIKCKDANGNTLYTRNKADCNNTIESVNGSKLKDQAKSKAGKVNYRVPQRNYIEVAGKWEIYVEASLQDGDPALYSAAVKKLSVVLDEVFSVLPGTASSQLSGLKYYILWGTKSPSGGRKSGMSYTRKGEPGNYDYLDPRWEHVIVVYSAENLIYLDNMWAKKAVMHELAHAWHLLHWPDRYDLIYQSWQNARNSTRYTNVADTKGKIIKTAYALKNQLEYFAELSAIYFVGGNYHPFNREGLVSYDPQGYKMIETLWR